MIAKKCDWMWHEKKINLNLFMYFAKRAVIYE